MPYTFPLDIRESVEAHLASGDFGSEDEVIREALATLDKRQASLRKMRAMVREAEEDIAAGRVGPFDRAVLKADVRQRLADNGIT